MFKLHTVQRSGEVSSGLGMNTAFLLSGVLKLEVFTKITRIIPATNSLCFLSVLVRCDSQCINKRWFISTMTQNNRWPCIWIGNSSASVTAMNHFPLVLLLPFYLSAFLIIQNSHLERWFVPGGREGKDPLLHKAQRNTTLLNHQEASWFIRQFSGYQCLSLLLYIGSYFPLNCLCPPDTRYVSWVKA